MSPLAVHEAGHAVTAMVLNVPWIIAAVRPDGTGYLRFDGHPADWGDRVLHRRAAIVSLAGAHAEAAYRQESVPWPSGDRRMAESYLRHADEPFEVLSDGARRCVERYWPAVQRVAEHLEVLGSISPREARACMQGRS